METNLFGEKYEKIKPISLSIYADEIKKNKNFDNETWLYLGLLLIQNEKKNLALDKLQKAREDANYFNEVHFSKLTNFLYSFINNEKTLLASKWLDLILNDLDDCCFYFNLLGINYSKINNKIFGSNKSELFQNIYNRFFRTLLKSSFNYFFYGREIIIEGIFHDKENNLEKHTYFNWHCINKLDEEIKNLSFKTNKIQFIDSNHNRENDYKDESNFIQLIDIILGSIRLCLDNTCKKDGCSEIANKMKPLLEKIMREPKNKNSKYDYFKKYSIGFFPSQSLTSDEILNPVERINSKIFQNRRMLMFNKINWSYFKLYKLKFLHSNSFNLGVPDAPFLKKY